MKRFVSTVLVATMVATSVPAWADPPTPAPTPAPSSSAPLPTITPLQKTQPAPYTGVLLSPEAIAKIVADKDAAAKEKELAVKHQQELDAAQHKYDLDQATTTCTADKSIMQARIDDNLKQIKILEDQLKKQSGGPGPGTWIGLGAVGGVVLTVVTVFAVSRATK